MKIEIYSFDGIEALAKSTFAPRTSLISIGDSDALPPKLKHKPEHILRLVFDDVTLDEARERLELPDRISDEKLTEQLAHYGFYMFSGKQAGQVAEFVCKHIDETDLLICQCHYGQSRSAGCAAAIAEHFYGNGVDIFADERYYPNKLVYQKVLRALEECKSEKERNVDND